MSELLYNRDVAIQIGTLRIASRQPGDVELSKPTLRMSFSVEKSLNRDPNKAEVQINNLAEKSRKSLQKKQPLIIEAGYTRTMQQLFSGDITFVSHTREGSDWVSTVQCGDGAEQYSSARMNVSFAPGTQMKALLKQAAEGLGVGIGNAVDKFTEGKFRKGITEFTKGAVASGRVSDILDKYVTTSGLQWSIQDGEMQVLEPDETTEEEVVSLSKESGLVGSPEIGEDGVVKAKSLLQGILKPGRQVQIQSLEVDGFFKIERVTHFGDTWGSDWYSELEAKPI